MNKVVLKGRLCADPEVHYAQREDGSLAIARFSLAVNRRGRDAGTDFIRCVAFGKSGEWFEKYTHKGQEILILGRIQTGSYEKDGQKVYTTDIVVEEQEFCGSKEGGSTQNQASTNEGFMSFPEGIDEKLPFN